MNGFHSASDSPADSARTLKGANAALGQGFTSVNGTTHNSALNIKSTGTEDTKTSSHIALTLSLQELAQSVSTEQSAGIGFLDFFGIQEKREFAKSLSLSTFSLCIVAHARKSSKTFCTEVNFTEEAAGFLPHDAPSAADFVRRYGDTYIKSIDKGGEYIGVLHFECSSSETQKTLKNNLEANGILKGLQLQADIEDAIAKSTKDLGCTLIIDSFISGISNPTTPSSPYEIIHFANTFATTQLDSPTTIAIDVAGYEDLSSNQSNRLFQAIKRNRGKIYGINASQDKGLIEQKRHLLDAKNQIDRLRDVYRFYHALSSCTDPALEEIKQANDSDCGAFERFLQDYINDPSKELGNINSPSLSKGVPTLAYTQTNQPLGKWDPEKPEGGNFQDFRDIKDVGAFLMKKTTIKSIQLQSGEWVDGLTTTYSYHEGESTHEFTCKHGGDGGGTQPELIFNQTSECSDYITKISANIDTEHLARLKVANKHDYTIGGENKYGGAEYSIKFSEGGQKIPFGFIGRASRIESGNSKVGGEVRQIGVICVTLLPATWERPFARERQRESPAG